MELRNKGPMPPKGLIVGAVAFLSLALCTNAHAAGQEPGVDSGDTTRVLVSAALVMLMTPGLAFFYGGLVRRRNMLSVLTQGLMILCIVSLPWVLLGYSLSFGPEKGSIIGGLEWLGLTGVGAEPNVDYASTIPRQTFMMFQMMFAVITPALIIGAFAERMRFSSFCVFTLLWATFLYGPVTHWTWGAGLLWFGWFGFNAGMALKSGAFLSSAFTVTHMAGATAGTTWALLDWLKYKKATTLGMITGAIAGLAAVTLASGFVRPAGAIWIGIGAGILPWLVVTCLKTRFNYDDTLNAFGVPA